MNCIYHPEKGAVTTCNRCKNPICDICLKREEGVDYCKSCASLRIHQVERKGLPLWLKGCGIGCGALLIISLICLGLIISCMPKIKEVFLEAQIEVLRQQRDKVIDRLKEGVEKEKIYKVFDDLEGMVRMGKIPFLRLAEFLVKCKEVVQDGEVDEKEVKEIMEEADTLREEFLK